MPLSDSQRYLAASRLLLLHQGLARIGRVAAGLGALATWPNPIWGVGLLVSWIACEGYSARLALDALLFADASKDPAILTALDSMTGRAARPAFIRVQGAIRLLKRQGATTAVLVFLACAALGQIV